MSVARARSLLGVDNQRFADVGTAALHAAGQACDSESQRSAGSYSQQSSQDGSWNGRHRLGAKFGARANPTSDLLDAGCMHSILKKVAAHQDTIKHLTESQRELSESNTALRAEVLEMRQLQQAQRLQTAEAFASMKDSLHDSMRAQLDAQLEKLDRFIPRLEGPEAQRSSSRIPAAHPSVMQAPVGRMCSPQVRHRGRLSACDPPRWLLQSSTPGSAASDGHHQQPAHRAAHTPNSTNSAKATTPLSAPARGSPASSGKCRELDVFESDLPYCSSNVKVTDSEPEVLSPSNWSVLGSIGSCTSTGSSPASLPSPRDPASFGRFNPIGSLQGTAKAAGSGSKRHYSTTPAESGVGGEYDAMKARRTSLLREMGTHLLDDL